MFKTLVMLITLSLSACASGPRVPVADLDKLSSQQKAAVNNIEIMNQTQLQGKRFKVSGVAEGHSCQWHSSQPPATRSAAIEQLKYYAQKMSGDAISNIECAPKEGTSLATNCWELISCTAEVISFER